MFNRPYSLPQGSVVCLFVLMAACQTIWADIDSASHAEPPRMMLADNKSESNEQPRAGTLVLPAAVDTMVEEEEKQCMTVCARWGEDCTFINRGSGGMTRKCRRACKQFAEECF